MFERQNVIASFRAELATVAAAERELLNRYSAASAHFKAGRINDAAFAEIMEHEVLEPYADIRREVAELKAHPDADSEFVAQLGRFTALRAEGWRLLVDALREQDQEKLRRYEQKMDEAVAIARKFMDAHESGSTP